MGIEAGLIRWSFPNNAAATDAALADAAVFPAAPADICFFLAAHNVTIVEVGVLIDVASDADTYAFTVARAPRIGGTYVVHATITGPAGAAMAADGCLKRSVNIFLTKGNVLRFSVTDATGAGTGQFYALGYPAGDPAVHGMGAPVAPAVQGIIPERVSTTGQVA